MLNPLLILIHLVAVSCHQTPIFATKSVLVVGSGAAGSSVVHFLKNSNLDLKCYEKSNLVGGRAKTVELLVNKEPHKIELGATIISINNFLLLNLSQEFNLKHKDSIVNQNYEIGIWNGNTWIFRFRGDSIWENIKLLWRYGFLNGPIQAKKIAHVMASKFFKVYEYLTNGNTWNSMKELLTILDLEHEATQNCKEYYMKQGISEALIDELLGGITRNIYLSDVDDLHSTACSVALYAGAFDTFQIEGGNQKIFEHMVDGKVELNVNVVKIENNLNTVLVTADKNGELVTETFDHVVLAAPAFNSGIEFVGFNVSQWAVPYIELYVTIVYGRLNPTYFNVNSELDIPESLFTPANSICPFYTLGIDRTVNETHSVSKLFSTKPLSMEQLDEIYLQRIETVQHAWNQPGSYPRLSPNQNWLIPVRDHNLWFVNGFESFISTMETEVISGWNIAMNINNLIF